MKTSRVGPSPTCSGEQIRYDRVGRMRPTWATSANGDPPTCFLAAWVRTARQHPRGGRRPRKDTSGSGSAMSPGMARRPTTARGGPRVTFWRRSRLAAADEFAPILATAVVAAVTPMPPSRRWQPF